MDKPLLTVVKSLNSQRAKYVVIGGNAVAQYGVPRATFDLDVFVEASAENMRRVWDALREAGMGTAYLTTPERMRMASVSEFHDWVPVDVMTRIPGVRFETAWRNRMNRTFNGVRIPFLSRKDLIRSKRAAGRDVDISDVAALMKAKPRRRRPRSGD